MGTALALKTYALAHLAIIMIILGVWVAIATFFSTRFPKPPPSAKWYVKFAHWFLVDWPSFIAAQNGKTYFGIKISIPFITWTVHNPSTSSPTAMLLIFLAPSLIFGGGWGCAFCKVQANQSTYRCKAEAVALCVAQDAEAILVSVLPSVAMALLTGNPEAALTAIVADLTANGVQDGEQIVSCAVSAIEKNTTSPASGKMFMAKLGASLDTGKLHDAAHVWLASHHPDMLK